MKKVWIMTGMILGLYGVFMMLFMNVAAVYWGGSYQVSYMMFNEMYWELVMNAAFFLTLFTLTVIAVKEYLRCK